MEKENIEADEIMEKTDSLEEKLDQLEILEDERYARRAEEDVQRTKEQ
jgi:hypothetical protein